MRTLSEELHLLQAWFEAERQPDHGWTEARRDAFAAKLGQLSRQAEGQEAALRMLEARQLHPVSAEAFVAALASGALVLLPSHRALVAHGCDASPDVPDRRFGEDAGGPA